VAREKGLLAIGASQAFLHDFISTALATWHKLGKETGLWDTYIRTDTQLLTKKKLGGNAKNIDYFDAVYFYPTGELEMDDEQKAALIGFVRDDGKGFLGGHSAADTFYKWPEYGDMTRAYFDLHPWHKEVTVDVADRAFPATAHFPPVERYPRSHGRHGR
jgi:type 1 glutamine amidotransferase